MIAYILFLFLCVIYHLISRIFSLEFSIWSPNCGSGDRRLLRLHLGLLAQIDGKNG